MNKAFLHFLPIYFDEFDDFSKFHDAFRAGVPLLKITKCSKKAKKLRNANSTCFKPIFLQHFQNPKLRFWVPTTDSITIRIPVLLSSVLRNNKSFAIFGDYDKLSKDQKKEQSFQFVEDFIAFMDETCWILHISLCWGKLYWHV